MKIPLKTAFVAVLLAGAAIGQETNQTTNQQRMEQVHSNMQAQVQALRERSAALSTNRPTVLFSNQNSLIISTPPLPRHLINTNYLKDHPEIIEQVRYLITGGKTNLSQSVSNQLQQIDDAIKGERANQ